MDMQNDFGSKRGMFDRAGIDIRGTQKVVPPTARTLAAARQAGIPNVYLKMGYRADLSDRRILPIAPSIGFSTLARPCRLRTDALAGFWCAIRGTPTS